MDGTLHDLCDDLAAEHASLDGVVAGLADDAWDTPTPAAGWRVRDQIGHLTFYDRAGLRAVTDPEGFARWRDESLADAERYLAESESIGRELAAGALLQAWRTSRADLVEAFRPVAASARLPWYGPPMSARSFVTARLMETWAHGQDVVDAVGARREPTDRLRHVAHLGVVTRGWSYVVRGSVPPDVPVHVALDPPSGGEPWTWGEPTTGDRVEGPALDFCLVVTQRRHLADTDLVTRGPAATGWMQIAQAFAGPPGEGRPPP